MEYVSQVEAHNQMQQNKSLFWNCLGQFLVQYDNGSGGGNDTVKFYRFDEGLAHRPIKCLPTLVCNYNSVMIILYPISVYLYTECKGEP